MVFEKQASFRYYWLRSHVTLQYKTYLANILVASEFFDIEDRSYVLAD